MITIETTGGCLIETMKSRLTTFVKHYNHGVLGGGEGWCGVVVQRGVVSLSLFLLPGRKLLCVYGRQSIEIKCL